MEDFIEIFDEIEDGDYDVAVRLPRIIHNRVDHFEKWDESEFFNRFRIHKHTANIVLHKIKDMIKAQTTKNKAISPEAMFLATLRYYASGSFLINVGDHSGIHVSTMSKIIKKVSTALAHLSQEYISMPSTHEEITRVKHGFYVIAHFPNCIGAIDCTHVRIQSSGGADAETFRNRKGFFSINVQTVSDSSLLIRDIVARWPGSSHDSHIFNSSRIKRRFENREFGTAVLVGDSGYAVRNYLITPLGNVNTREEQLFQEAITRTRNPVERSYGVWKRRFPVLATGIRLKMDRIQSIIVATAVLHNIACNENENLPPVTEDELNAINAVHDFPQEANNHPHVAENNVRRNHLIHQYFHDLLENQ